MAILIPPFDDRVDKLLAIWAHDRHFGHGLLATALSIIKVFIKNYLYSGLVFGIYQLFLV